MGKPGNQDNREQVIRITGNQDEGDRIGKLGNQVIRISDCSFY